MANRDLARWFTPSQAQLHSPFASRIDRSLDLRNETLARRAANYGTDVYRHGCEVSAICYPPQPKLAVVIGHNERKRSGMDPPGHARPNRGAALHRIQLLPFTQPRSRPIRHYGGPTES